MWCFSGFTGEGDQPYEWRPLELGFACEAGIPTVYEASSPEVEVKPFYGESGDVVIAVNHGEDKTTTITSSKPIESISKIGGDAEVVSWSTSSVELSMPRKSSIILHIESRGKAPLS